MLLPGIQICSLSLIFGTFWVSAGLMHAFISILRFTISLRTEKHSLHLCLGKSRTAVTFCAWNWNLSFKVKGVHQGYNRENSYDCFSTAIQLIMTVQTLPVPSQQQPRILPCSRDDRLLWQRCGYTGHWLQPWSYRNNLSAAKC